MSWTVPRSVPREFCAGSSNGDSTSNKSRKHKDVEFHEGKTLLDRRGHLMGSDRLLERERLLPQVVDRGRKRKRARFIVPLHRMGELGAGDKFWLELPGLERGINEEGVREVRERARE